MGFVSAFDRANLFFIAISCTIPYQYTVRPYIVSWFHNQHPLVGLLGVSFDSLVVENCLDR